MKRIISILVILTLALSLCACGGGKGSGGSGLPFVPGTVYTGTLYDGEAKIIIDGNNAVVQTVDVQDEGSAKITTSVSVYGAITSKEDNTVVISFSGEGAKMIVHVKVTGEQAFEMLEILKAAASSNIQNATDKKLYLDICDGKVVTITPANTEIWGIFAPTYDVTATLNDADKTFTSIEEWG